MTQLNSNNSNRLRNLVTFRLEQRTYALPVEPIAQIIEMVTIIPILQAEDSVAGVINVRGAAVPVVNMRGHFGLPEVPLQLNTPIILARIDGRVVGLIVDEVIDVLSLSAAQIARPADILPEGMVQPPVLGGVAYTPDDALLLLDVEHLFSPSQMQKLAEVIESMWEIVVGKAPEGMAVQAGSRTAGGGTPEESPAKAEPPPARSRRKRRTRAKKAAEASSTGEEPQSTPSRRKRRRRTKAAAAESPEEDA
jgi:purine-binding chemotaxis protein CheW